MTSSGSAELIAVSSLFTYDGYWHYINPRATGKQLLLVSRILILAYTVLMGDSPTHHTPPPPPLPLPSSIHAGKQLLVVSRIRILVYTVLWSESLAYMSPL